MSFVSIGGEQHIKPCLPQRRRKHAPQRQIVIDDEDAFAVDVSDALLVVRIVMLNFTPTVFVLPYAFYRLLTLPCRRLATARVSGFGGRVSE
jgi:hypothetical protein